MPCLVQNKKHLILHVLVSMIKKKHKFYTNTMLLFYIFLFNLLTLSIEPLLKTTESITCWLFKINRKTNLLMSNLIWHFSSNTVIQTSAWCFEFISLGLIFNTLIFSFNSPSAIIWLWEEGMPLWLKELLWF